MLHDLKQVAAKTEANEPDEFIEAAAALLSRQFLFVDNKFDKKHYYTIISAPSYFSNLFEALKRQLVYNTDHGFAGIVGVDTRGSICLKKDELMMLVCLRMIYEEEYAKLNTDKGSVWISSNDLANAFEAVTKTVKLPYPRFKVILELFAHHGIITRREEDKETRSIRLQIRPSIRHVMPEDYTKAIEDYLQAAEDGEVLLDADESEELDEGIA